MDEPTPSVHFITRAALEKAIEGQSSLFLSESVRFVHTLLLAIQKGERIVVEDEPK